MLSSDDSSAVELSELSNTTRPRFRSRHQSPHSFPLFPGGKGSVPQTRQRVVVN